MGEPAGTPDTVTRLLHAWSAGDAGALDRLVPIVYDELRRQARRALRHEGVGHTLQPTALVHEAYLRLAGQRDAHWRGRAQFFGVAAHLMRRVLIDHARARRAAKRGGAVVPAPLSDGAVAGAEGDRQIVELDEALGRLAALDPRQARVVELRYLAGLGVEETAEALAISPATVKREWAMARAWLRRELAGG